MNRFLHDPATIRSAASVVVSGTVAVVIVSGLLMRLFDRSEFPNVWRGFWFALQTVTTVGFGDVTPRNVSGRIVGAVVMLWGIAFLSILTAAITSVFVTRAHEQAGALGGKELESRLDDLAARLDRIEKALPPPEGGAAGTAPRPTA
jgi:hypothetical protein